jgi:hypothetical protein
MKHKQLSILSLLRKGTGSAVKEIDLHEAYFLAIWVEIKSRPKLKHILIFIGSSQLELKIRHGLMLLLDGIFSIIKRRSNCPIDF